MKIWAHRGCSQRYPENTLLAFEKAAEISGLTGIELDIQFTKDNYMVVCHDERVDRTTDGIGELRQYTLTELRKLRINAGDGKYEKIPTIGEVIDLLEDQLQSGMKLNIELKNSIFSYKGLEEKIIDLVYQRGYESQVMYSTFYAKSLQMIRKLDPNAELGILDRKASDCLYKLKGGCGADAIHPYWQDLDVPLNDMKSYAVRAWMSGHLYPEKPTGTRLDMDALEAQGITDIFLNEPEMYL